MTSSMYASCARLTSRCVSACSVLYRVQSLWCLVLLAFLCARCFLLDNLFIRLFAQGLVLLHDVILDGMWSSINLVVKSLMVFHMLSMSVYVWDVNDLMKLSKSFLMESWSALSHIYIFLLTGLHRWGVISVSSTMSWSLLPKGGKHLHLSANDGWEVNN